MFKKRKEASITVEAAFIVPIVIFVVLALIYLTFCLHDRVKLEEVVERALGQGNLLAAERAEIEGAPCNYKMINQSGNWGYFKVSYENEEEALRGYLEEQLNHGFFILNVESVSCKVNGFQAEITVKMKGKISLNPVKNMLGKTTEFVLKRTVSIHNPEEAKRAYEELQIAIDHIGDFNFVKGYMRKLESTLEEGVN